MQLKPWGLVLSLVVVVAAVVGFFWLMPSPVPSHSEFDVQFESIRIGMSRSEVEGLLGPSLVEADATVHQIVGSRPYEKLTNRIWWHDGRYKCLSVEFDFDGRVEQAELFTHGSYQIRKLTEANSK